ncbi:DUF4293 domain-containing protein [Cryomorpha ignava]|uniref:DUF4293 domain-containing protein n=1 Tax=Cryomorpha ignava TaxID=101383 RepID=A0A7K3WLN9_9FLAO|nr:DUF4293 domain-containing protein [Cryomorpha ignava]NEN22384.1 DUF4293 domain-containing protein [Cryomorpha ignava]
MIQRVQSIYLVLATLAGAMTFFLPYAHFYANETEVAEFAMFGVFNVQSQVVEMMSPFGFPAWIFGAFAVLIPLISIFLYKKRPVQMRIVRLAYLINLGYIVYLFFAIDAINDQVFDGALDILHHTGFYMPVIAIVFCFLAVRGIKADEALVKSLDRIR